MRTHSNAKAGKPDYQLPETLWIQCSTCAALIHSLNTLMLCYTLGKSAAQKLLLESCWCTHKQPATFALWCTETCHTSGIHMEQLKPALWGMRGDVKDQDSCLNIQTNPSSISEVQHYYLLSFSSDRKSDEYLCEATDRTEEPTVHEMRFIHLRFAYFIDLFGHDDWLQYDVFNLTSVIIDSLYHADL